MGVILINGVPGSGKTTIAINLAKNLGIEQVIQTDTIKEIFHIQNHPEITYCATHNAWKFLGNKTQINIIKGFILHTAYFTDHLIKLINLTQIKGKNIIIEGVQATPYLYSLIKTKEKIAFFLTTDESERLNRLNLKNNSRFKKNNGWYENFDAINIIDKFLKNQAIKYKVNIIENNDLDNTLKIIEEKISQELDINFNKIILEAKNDLTR